MLFIIKSTQKYNISANLQNLLAFLKTIFYYFKDIDTIYETNPIVKF